MEITRNVILDLLPLYLANEVSDDTRSLIEKYLETDPDLAHLVTQSASLKLPKDIPVPLTQENKIKAYKKTRWIIILSTVILAGLLAIILMISILMFFIPSS